MSMVSPKLKARPALRVCLTANGIEAWPGTPEWVTRIAGWTRSVATDEGTVLTRDPEGHVLLLAPGDGRVVWASKERTTSHDLGPWPAVIACPSATASAHTAMRPRYASRLTPV